jgi:hypothetical protein
LRIIRNIIVADGGRPFRFACGATMNLRHEELRQRWDRIGIGIRCAYNPWLPPVILLYLQAGRRLVSAGAMDDATVQRRMLTLLMRTADDQALPLPWRMACLEHTTRPRARLERLLASRDPAAVHRIARDADAVLERLDAAFATGGYAASRSGD